MVRLENEQAYLWCEPQRRAEKTMGILAARRHDMRSPFCPRACKYRERELL
jgi:hypothetical protein